MEAETPVIADEPVSTSLSPGKNRPMNSAHNPEGHHVRCERGDQPNLGGPIPQSQTGAAPKLFACYENSILPQNADQTPVPARVSVPQEYHTTQAGHNP